MVNVSRDARSTTTDRLMTLSIGCPSNACTLVDRGRKPRTWTTLYAGDATRPSPATESVTGPDIRSGGARIATRRGGVGVQRQADAEGRAVAGTGTFSRDLAAVVGHDAVGDR